MGKVYIGTSGWVYKEWQKHFYFNNDLNVHAPDNAKMLMQMIGKAAVQPKPEPMTNGAGKLHSSFVIRHYFQTFIVASLCYTCRACFAPRIYA